MPGLKACGLAGTCVLVFARAGLGFRQGRLLGRSIFLTYWSSFVSSAFAIFVVIVAYLVVDPKTFPQDVNQSLLSREAHKHARHAANLHIPGDFALLYFFFYGQYAIRQIVQVLADHLE